MHGAGALRKLVILEQFITLEGAPPAYLPFIASMTPETAPPVVIELDNSVSPDGPEHFPTVMNKLHDIWTTPAGIEVSDLTNVTASTLVLLADKGAMVWAQTAQVQATLPDCQIAVVPGTSHGVAIEKPHGVNQMVLDFLAPDQAPRMMPLPES